MRNKFYAALSFAVTLCMLAGCSTENEQSSENHDINIIDVGSAQPVSSSSLSTSSSSLAISSSSMSTIVSMPAYSSQSSSDDTVFSGSLPESSFSVPEDSGSTSGYIEPSVSENVSSSISENPQTTVSSDNGQSGYVEPPIDSESSASSTVMSVSTVASTSAMTSFSSSAAVSSSASQVSSVSSEPTPVPVEPSGNDGYYALNYDEVRGMWISYLDMMEMSSGTESAFRSEIAEAYDNCTALGINTVYVHVRSHGDAYYNSDYFPRTKYLSGSYDPLPIMIEEAHKRNLSFQAWINPLRMCSVSDVGRESGYPLSNWIGGEMQLVKVGSYYYLNPAYSEVIDLIARSAAEIIANYDVDGLHIDDYFYPTTDSSFDKEAFGNSGFDYISDFRRGNCDKLVSTLYSTVKTANSSAVFGVSCQGNMSNNYNQMYADVEKWCISSGYVDYIMPQIYFGFDNSSQPFADCVRNWDNLAVKGNVPLIVGLTAAKFGAEDVWAGAGRDEWITDRSILKRQFLESLEQTAYGGICLFRYGCIFAPESSIRSQVEQEISELKSVMNIT